MGQADISTTMIHLHVMKRPGAGAQNPRTSASNPTIQRRNLRENQPPDPQILLAKARPGRYPCGCVRSFVEN